MGQTQTVLITGASTGIGFELARIFARRRSRLILIAQSSERLGTAEEKLRQEGAAEIWSEVCDLSDRRKMESWLDGLASRLEERRLEVDVLVNNAGFGIDREFSDGEWENDREMMDLNIFALTRLTKKFVPAMRARGSGRILQVASTAAFQPGPGMALYFASKAFVLSFSKALSEELRESGVTVTSLCPGPTRTRFEERMGGGSALFRSGLPVATAEEVAECGYRALMAGKRVAIHGMRNRFLASMVRWIPSAITLRVMAKITGAGRSARTNQAENLPTP